MQLKPPVSNTDHSQGAVDAPVTLVEYGDYECPHCGHAYPVVKRLQKHFGSKLRFVFRNFPSSEIHANAEAAAETAEFAATKGKFWEIHDGLFEQQSELSPALFKGLAVENGLDPKELANALSAHTYGQKVKSDFMSGVRSGVNGTPTFFINGMRHDAAPDFASLSEAIRQNGGG